jgi:hypothetical protein
MSEIRSVSVHLDADVAGYIAKMRLAGAETDRAFDEPSRIDHVQKQLDAAQKALAPQQRQFHDSLETLQADFAKFIRGPAGQDLLGPFTQGLKVADDLLPHVTPIIGAVSDSLSGLLGEVDKAAQSPGFDRFIHQVSDQIGPDLRIFGHILGGVTTGIGDLLLVLGKHLSPPLMREVERLAAGFADWASSRGARQDVKSFIAYFREVGPEVADTIGAVARALGHIVEALAPLGPPTLRVIQGIADAISAIPIPVLTGIAGAAAGLVVLQKTGGFKALSFGSKLLGGSAPGGGGVAGSVLGGGVQKVFVVNMPGGGLGGPGGVAGGGPKGFLGKAGTLGLGVAAIGALNEGGAKILMAEYGKTLGGAVASSLRGVLSLPDPALASAGVHVGTSILHGITSSVSGGFPAVIHKVFGGSETTTSIKSVGTAFESLKHQLSQADQQFEITGHHAGRAFDGSAQSVEKLQNKVNSITGAHANQQFELVRHSAEQGFGRAGASADQLQGHINNLHGKRLDVTVNGGQSLAVLRDIAARVAALHDKTIDILTVRHTGGRSVPGDAGGGTIPGPRAPYGDRVLRLLAPGEEVISNRYGQADRHRPLLKRINARGMADGGTVTADPSGDPVHLRPFANEIHGATGHLHDLNQELAAETKAVQKERQQRDSLVQDRQALVSTVKSGFRSELFGVSGAPSGVWAPGAAEFADPLHILHQDIRDAREYRTDIRRLRRRGLSRAAAAQVTTLEAAEQLEGDSRHQLREFSRLFGIRQRASQAAGATIGDIRYSRQIAESNQHLKHLRDAVHHTNQEIRETNHRLADLHKSQDKAVAKQAKATADALNKTASVAVRRRRGDTG